MIKVNCDFFALYFYHCICPLNRFMSLPVQDVDDDNQEKAEKWLTARKLVRNEEYPESCWCYDTPGIVSDKQVLCLV